MSREEYKDAIEVSVIFHEGQRMFAVPKQPAQQEPAGSVYRYGKDSSGTPWHGVRWTASGLDLPDGTLIYTSPPAQQEPVVRIAELEETVRHLNHALREATEAPTFMGEPVSAEPAASIKGVDEYGPMLNWYTHWVNFPVGTKLYTSPQPAQQEPVAWCPDVCPITGLPFFMWIEHHETGQNVPTYGGPYDSYTIPVRDKDGSYCRERYDHDLGGWRADEVEDVGIQIVSDQAYVSDYEPPASKPLTDEQRKKLRDAFAQALTSVYVCGRVWEAWQYGTMSEGDFQPASECTEVLDSLIEAAHEITGETK